MSICLFDSIIILNNFTLESSLKSINNDDSFNLIVQSIEFNSHEYSISSHFKQYFETDIIIITKETHAIKVNDLSFHIVKFEDLEGFQI